MRKLISQLAVPMVLMLFIGIAAFAWTEYRSWKRPTANTSNLEISLSVSDAATGSPVEKALVSRDGSNQALLTNRDGVAALVLDPKTTPARVRSQLARTGTVILFIKSPFSRAKSQSILNLRPLYRRG